MNRSRRVFYAGGKPRHNADDSVQQMKDAVRKELTRLRFWLQEMGYQPDVSSPIAVVEGNAWGLTLATESPAIAHTRSQIVNFQHRSAQAA